MRKITVDNQVWRYTVGTGWFVARKDNEKLLIALWRLLGYSNPMDWERDKRKQSRYANVTPRLVADFIRHSEWYLAADWFDIIKLRESWEPKGLSVPKGRSGAPMKWCESCRDYHE